MKGGFGGVNLSQNAPDLPTTGSHLPVTNRPSGGLGSATVFISPFPKYEPNTGFGETRTTYQGGFVYPGSSPPSKQGVRDLRCAAPARPEKVSGNKKPDIIPGKTPPQNNGNSDSSVTGEDKTKAKVDDDKAAKGK
ncbi:hypothetical protein RHMOL_Rhmol04G0246400 [Rhododendron molle]|uniref:Uncharacterized protein n=1 Tax=Rhododendron molle TaxID=49168 RepID=A0ACC0P537_RHOML|nr:hypothetical protein RHMOL_Rhmol04G0246400 [Rhododendron molle]